MTVSSNNRRFESPGNGVTTVFPGPRIFLASQLSVYEVDNATLAATLLTNGVHYTLTGIEEDQCTVTMVAPPAVGKTLLRLRTVPYSQTFRFKNQGAFFPELHENCADIQGMQIQQLSDRQDLSVHFPETTVGFSGALTSPIANYLLAVNPTNDGLVVIPPSTVASLGTNFLQLGTGAVLRPVQDKLREVRVSPDDFGAVGDFNPETYTGTNDAAAFNTMLDWLRTQVARDGFGVTLSVPDRDQFTKFVIRLRPGAIYRVDSTLNFTGFRSRGIHVMGNGATIYSYGINNKPVIDAIWSRGLYFHDLLVYAENGAYSGSLVQPSYGIVVGRKNSDDASEHHFENVRIVGWFNNSAYMNISSELVKFSKCAFENYVTSSSDFTGLSLHITDTVENGFTSDFQTIGALPAFGMNENLFDQCNMQSANGPVIRLNGVTRSCEFKGCYAAATSARPVVVVRGDHYKLELDIDCETSASTANVEFDTATNNVSVFGFRIRDHAPQAQNLMRTRGGIGTVFIYNGEIDVHDWTGANAATARLAANTPIQYHGIIKLSSTSATLHNFTGFTAIRADIHTRAAAAAITALPGTGYIVVHSYAESEPYFLGIGGVAARFAGAVRAGAYRDTNNVQVLGTRIPGWGAPTGTATRTTFATGSVTLPQLAERLKALIDDLTTHGVIGS
jgi:hypothetical protein